jgi:hypothetical protein
MNFCQILAEDFMFFSYARDALRSNNPSEKAGFPIKNNRT